MSTAERPRPDVARPRVLIAADDPLLRKDLAETLADEGFAVVGQVGAGKRAAALAAELRPDLVKTPDAMDSRGQLPGKNDTQAVAQIAGERTTPVIILTAFSDRELIQRALNAGVLSCLARPFSTARLLLAIEFAAVLHADVAASGADVGVSTQRPQPRKVVDRATRLLMTQGRMTEPHAFRWLQRTAMNRRTSMYAVAKGVIERPQENVSSAPCRRQARPRRKDEVR